MKDEWLNAEDAAKYLNISITNLYAMAQTNKIPAHKVGKMWRFNIQEINTWIKTNRPVSEFFTSLEFNVEENLLLRDPQREAYSAANDFFIKGGRSAIIQLPVGCGKTGLIAILPLGIVRGRVLVIAPNLTIKEELSRALDVTNKRFCFWNKCRVMQPDSMLAGPYLATLDSVDANIHDCTQSHIVLTNIQQLASGADRWLPLFSNDFFDMILVDEGHHSAAPSWKKVFGKFQKAKVVNLTATPFRSDQQEIEGELVYRYSFKRAMIKGYIKKIQATYVAPEEIYFTYEGNEKHHTLEEVLRLKEEEWFSRGVAMSPVCNKSIVDASLDKLEKLRQSGTRHQLIAVACSVNHARQIRSLFMERGYEAAEIHSQMPPDKQAEVIQKLRTGILDCIIQVQMLGEGFDHPLLSVAAIFRPFRTLPPYVQFVGRIMRVIVQNDPRHPDNYGHIVTHIGLNLDKQLEDFRKIDREDREYFTDIMEGKEPEPPREVLEGRTRQKLSESMIVHKEIVDSFLQEHFIDPDDETLLEEMKGIAESLGFDVQEMAEVLKKKQSEKTKTVEASSEFPIIPQRQRIEARRRLQEQVKRTAKILLNRLNISMDGRDLAFKLATGRGLTGNNFAAAVQLVNHEVNRLLKIETGDRNKLRTEDYQQAIDGLENILNTLTKRIKKGEKEND
ncbi:MAG: helix-turn-helix domain-containing protein [Planctomycetes bacterium]|nr:helix-turn-helix domain-containing protein [Planctomycetota bacterium]